MKAIFADTFFYLAVLNPADAAHRQAVNASRTLTAQTLTTAWVMTEVADALAGPAQRPLFLDLLRRLSADSKVTIVPPTQEFFDRGVDFYAKRPDKQWSLTDCISFVVMAEHGLTEALTGDWHFEQAGFKVLLSKQRRTTPGQD